MKEEIGALEVWKCKLGSTSELPSLSLSFSLFLPLSLSLSPSLPHSLTHCLIHTHSEAGTLESRQPPFAPGYLEYGSGVP